MLRKELVVRLAADGDLLEPVRDADGKGEECSLRAFEEERCLAWARRTFRALVLEELRAITASDEEWRSEARALLGVDP